MAKQGVFRTVFLCLALAALVAAGLAHSLHTHWSGDDDNAYLLMTGLNVAERGEGAPLLDAFLAMADAEGFREDGLASMQARRDGLYNYLLPSAVYGLAYRVAAQGGGAGSYASHGADALLFGFAGAAALALAISLTLMAGARPSVALAGLAVLGTLLILQHYAPAGGAVLLDWEVFLGHLPLALANPGTGLGPFGETPRSNLALLAVFVFLLRADGRWRSAYALAALSLLFHRQHGALLLAAILVADLVIRPRVLLQGVVILIAAAAAIYVGLTEPALDALGLASWADAAILIALLAGAVLLASAHARWRSRQPAHPAANALADLAVYAVLFVLVVVLSLAARGFDLGGGSSPAAIWPVLPSRFLGIVQPQIYIAAALMILALLPRSPAGDRVLRFATAAIGAALIIFAAVGVVRSWPRIDARTSEVAARFAGNLRLAPLGVTDALSFRDEERVYVALGAQLAGEGERFDQLMAATPQGGAFPVIAMDQEAALAEVLRNEGCAFLTAPLPGAGPDGAPIAGTPFDAALAWSADRSIQLLAAFSASCGEPVPQPVLCYALYREHLSLVRGVADDVRENELDAPCATPLPAAADPNAAGPPLCFAVAHVGGVVAALLNAGASPAPPGGCGPAGITPLDLATERGNDAAAALIREAIGAGP